MAFWLWIVIAAVVVSIVGVLFSRIRVRVRYSRSGKLDQLIVVFHAAYGLFRYQIILPSIVIRGWHVVYRDRREGGLPGGRQRKQKSSKIGRGTLLRYRKAYRTIQGSTKKFKSWAVHTLKQIECTRWRLDFRVGTGDAASTAVVTGLLWAVSGCASGVAGQFITLKTTPQGKVAPNYSTAEFAVVWEADFRIRLAAALWSLMKLGRNTIRFGKAVRAWHSLLSGPSGA